MLNLQQRIGVLARLQEYMLSDTPEWKNIKENAALQNPWFIPDFIERAVQNIAVYLLDPLTLNSWVKSYDLPQHHPCPANIGITMAGNIPLVGFHDFLCIFISGHRQTIKLSSKDKVLLKHLIGKITGWEKEADQHFSFAEILKGCDAFIATGSDNTARYFEYYFRKYPHIIRKNRTSVGILGGNEDGDLLNKLADDVFLYFGLGCRNVTKLYVPCNYDFLPLLNAFKKYASLIENHKYKHNYDYNLAIYIMNQLYYMTNGSVILSENTSVFSPISVLHYEYYNHTEDIYSSMNPEDIQCIAGPGKISFGSTQSPGLTDYPDGIDTILFLKSISGNPQQALPNHLLSF